MESLLAELITALQQQTVAINNLAESNRLIIECMAGSEDEPDPDDEPRTYMDGTPCP